MITARERALQLFHAFDMVLWREASRRKELSKELALTAVDEIIQSIIDYDSLGIKTAQFDYWQEVKNEIEKI